MTAFFNFDELRPADIIHSLSRGKMSRQITRVIGSKGSHDALFLGQHAGIGESIMWPPFSSATPVDSYEDRMRSGDLQVAVLRVPGMTAPQGHAVVAAWFKHVRGTFYDFAAFPRLFIKATIADVYPKAAGWEWAHWCTEGLRVSYLSGSHGFIDPWAKPNPTPRTTENRLAHGALVNVSDSCLTRQGQQYELQL